MYNSSIKGQDDAIALRGNIEIPHKVFFNDMSKTWYRSEFSSCDVIFSEISWIYGYGAFNEKAGNSPNAYSDYIININRLIESLDVPAFIVCGKNIKRYFPKAKMYPITINNAGRNMPGCTLYVWNYDYNELFAGTKELIDGLSGSFKKCLDFSCGYGEHLLKFDDFVGCDINRNCLTYLSIITQEKEKQNV